MTADRNRYPFIVLEGTDGSGKSTLRNLLHARLNEEGFGCFMVGQHSWLDVEAGRTITAVRQQRAGVARSELTAAYATDKTLHLRHNIIPALHSVAVLADRYIYSDAVYHEALFGVPAEDTLALHDRLGSLRPDAVVFVDARPDVAFGRTITRAKQRRAHESLPILQDLHTVFHRLFVEEKLGGRPVNVIHVDNNAAGPAAMVEHILPALQDLFPQRTGPRSRPEVAARGR
jgi:dTMP kinase